MLKYLAGVLRVTVWCLCLTACGGTKEKSIEFIYVALGASDATGVGAVPMTEGYVYLIARELDRQLPGVFLINLGVPGARIEPIKEQVRVAKQLGIKADLVTLWTGSDGHYFIRRGRNRTNHIEQSLIGRTMKCPEIDD